MVKSGCSAIVCHHDAHGFGSIHFINWVVPRTVAEGDEGIAAEIVQDLEAHESNYVQHFDIVTASSPSDAVLAPASQVIKQFPPEFTALDGQGDVKLTGSCPELR
jgi:hypothetical protein